MRVLRFFATALTIVAVFASIGSAQSVDPDLAQGFYLEQQRHDPAAAAKYFERVLNKNGINVDDVRVARRHLAACLEADSVKDLARLMPPDALLYAEIHEPGQHLEQVADALGILPDGDSMDDGQGSQAVKRIELDGGLSLPVDFKISPALIAEMSQVRSVAVAVTGFDREGPMGVVVIDAGDSNLLRGLVETGIQLLEPVAAIEGYKTYQIENEVWLTATHRTIIASRSKESVVEVVRRMKDSSAAGLAGHDAFRQAREQSRDPLAFAFVAGPTLRKVILEQAGGQEAMVVNAMLDLNNLEYVSAAANTADEKVTLDLNAKMAEGHNCLAYGLIRTSPITQSTTRLLPSSLAAYALLGLNEAGLAPGKTPHMMSALDVGRELFANIQQVAVFALPTIAENSNEPIPNVGALITASDVARSEALWNQLLSMPSRLGVPDTNKPTQLDIAGREASKFQIPEAPPIVICRVSDRHLMVGTEGAVRASLEEEVGYPTPVISPSSESPAHKLVEVDVDRVLEFAAKLQPGDADEINHVRRLVQELTVALSTHEGENSLQIHAEVRGLPKLRSLLEQVEQVSKAGNVEEDIFAVSR